MRPVTSRVGQPPQHEREPGRYTFATGDDVTAAAILTPVASRNLTRHSQLHWAASKMGSFSIDPGIAPTPQNSEPTPIRSCSGFKSRSNQSRHAAGRKSGTYAAAQHDGDKQISG
jgi:hypothetical protein